MDIDRLYSLCEREKLNVIEKDFDNIDGIYLENYRTIGLNKKMTTAEKKTVFSHELAHYYTDSTYTLLSDQSFIDKQEYAAKKWCFNTLISIEDLNREILNENSTNYTLAEKFNVTEQFMCECIQYYLNKGLLKTINY